MDRIKSSCYFCVSFKCRLLVLASIKLILALLLVIFFTYGHMAVLKHSWTDKSLRQYGLVMTSVPLIMWSLDILFTIVLIFGTYKKSVQLLWGYSVYSAAVAIIAGVWLLFITVLRAMAEMPITDYFLHPFYVLYGTGNTPLLDIALQSYFTLVIRAELMKLDASKFNSADEAPARREYYTKGSDKIII